MSVICYRDGMLAADSGSWGGDVIRGSMIKAVRTQGGLLVGATGSMALCETFPAWVDRNLSLAWPNFRFPQFDVGTEAFGAIVVKPTGGVVMFSSSGRPIAGLQAPFYADGAAMEMAMGAMAMGATAAQAVEVCIEHHSFAAGEVTSVHLDDFKHEMHMRRKP